LVLRQVISQTFSGVLRSLVLLESPQNLGIFFSLVERTWSLWRMSTFFYATPYAFPGFGIAKRVACLGTAKSWLLTCVSPVLWFNYLA
jgi:hypothetical protein